MPGRPSPASAKAEMEGIAVIGMGCRFSGEATSVENFWQMLREGRTGHGKIPSSRYEASAWHHPSHDRKGAINHDSGFFLKEDPSRFDAPFFSITAKEAAGMDPAQRLLLEVAYETFENAGVPIESLTGSDTAVYSGSMTNDYELLSTRDMYDMPHNAATGNGRTMLANRLSWFFDLQGPSIMMDTACSSSLTAVHLAAQALQSKECGMALVTGASLMLHPNFTQRLSYMHMMSPDGMSHSFDESANGYGRGEGIGAVLLKPVSAALADGDNIRAIIRATGINQDGRTPGITLPSPTSQANLIRSIYERHGLSMRDTTYFEAHGTGTPVGDPTELSAVGVTLGQARTETDEPLYVGSVKTNLGHTEGAAGVASLIKVILCLENETLVPNAGFKNINPKIRLDEWRLRLSNETIPWPDHLPQRASINSFGFGGSNAHIVIESAKEAFRSEIKEKDPPPQVVVFSTFDQAGIERIGQDWKSFLQQRANTERHMPLKDLAHTMLNRRSHLGFRSFAIADSVDQLYGNIEKGLPKFPRASRKAQTRLAFIFTGQGGQWAGMGKQLLEINTFRESMEQSQAILTSLGCPYDMFEEVLADANKSQINRPDRSQPITCAIQIALVDLLASWSVVPTAVTGHSSGEIAAAYAAGYLSHNDAMRLAWFRGFFSQQAAESDRRGGMLATGISEQDAQKYLNELPPRSVVVACVNSPASTTLSGDADKIDQLEKTLQEDGLFARKLRVDTAYHSPHMEALVEVVSNAIECIKPEDRFDGSIPMLSSVTKTRVYSAELGGPYWIQNMISAVEFNSAVSQLANLGESIKGRRRPVPIKWTALIEIGPHAVLKGPVTQILQSVSPGMVSLPYHSMIARNQNALRTSLEVAGSLWSTAHKVDLAAVNGCVDPKPSKMIADLPSYTWNHQNSFWHEPLETTQLRRRRFPRHDILGAPLDYQNDLEPRWRNFLRLSENPWMADHVVAGSIVFPAAGMMVMAIEAARQMADGSTGLKGIEFQDLQFLRGVVIPEEERGLEIVLQVSPHPGMSGWFQFGIFSLPSGGAWIQHAKGAFTPRYENHKSDEHIANWETRVARVKQTQGVAQKADIQETYQWLSQIGGLTVGPCFKTITDVFFCESEPRLWLSGVVTGTKQGMPHEVQTSSFIHPTTLDCLFQSALLSCSEALGSKDANIPVGVDHAYISEEFQPQSGENFVVHTESQWRDGKSRSQCIASDPSLSKPWITFEGVHLGRLPFSPNIKKEEEATSQSRYSSIVWNEHLKSPFPASRVSDEGTQHEAVKPSGLDLKDWMERLCHTHGDAKLLLTTSEPLSPLIDNLQNLAPTSGNRPCLGKIATAFCGPSGDGQEEKAPTGTHVASLAGLDQISSLSLSDDQYDMIVIDDISLWEVKMTQPVLSFLSASLGHGGFAALRVSDKHLDSALKALQAFDGLEPHSLTKDRTFIIAGQKSARWNPPSEVYILGAENKRSSLIVEHLAKAFASNNIKPVPVELDRAAELAGKTVISLLDLEAHWLLDWTETDLKRLQELIQAQHVLFVSPFWAQGTVDNAAYGAIAGLVRTLRNEQWSMTMPQLLVDEKDMQDELGLARGIMNVLQLTTQEDSRRPDLEYRLSNGRLLVGRALKTPAVDEAMHTLVHGSRPVLGDLALDSRPLALNTKDTNNTFWQEQQTVKHSLRPDHVELRVELATIFHSDAASSLEVGLPMFEIVGTVQEAGSEARGLSIGDKVLTLVSEDCGLSTAISVPQSDAIKIPSGVDPTRIISAPVAYLHAWRSLTQVGDLRSTSAVLLVGLMSQSFRAMIDYALSMEIHVIVATDSQNTIDALISRYPSLKDRVLGIHGSLEASVSRLTNGCGVEATISFLGGYAGRVAAKCLVEGGHYINLSSDMKLSALPESFIDSGCTFSSPQLRKTFSEKPGNLHASIRNVINFMERKQMLDHVETHPIFPISEIQKAFKHCKDNNIRAIVDLKAPGRVPILLPPPELIGLSDKNTYILAGGLGNLGIAFANILVDSGARHLVFLGRSRTTHPVAQDALDRLGDLGCRIDVVRCDISKKEDIEKLASEICTQQWNVTGIIQCATVLRDTMFENMTFDEWSQSTDSKIRGTLNLHNLFSQGELDFFVGLSSVSSVVGNMGQANYAAGNGFIDALMEWRRNHGLPGHSINIGLVPDASGLGDISEDQESRRRRYMNLGGTEIMTNELQTLFRVIINSNLSLPPQIIAGMTGSLSRQNPPSAWVFDRRFDHRLSITVDNDGTTKAQTSSLLKNSGSLDAAGQIVLDALSEYLAHAMATTADSIDPDLPLSGLGVDSLKATDVQNWVSRELGAELSSFEFLGSQPTKTLASKIAAASSYVSVAI